MSKLQVKIDGELWQRGKLFIHGDTEPEAIINTKGKSTVNIEALKKYFEEKMLLNKCGICGGLLYEHTDLETANQYIYCPKCKEEHDKFKQKITSERKETRNAENKG